MTQYRATLVVTFEADDLADAVETLETLCEGGLGMITAMVEHKRVTRLRRTPSNVGRANSVHRAQSPQGAAAPGLRDLHGEGQG